MRQLSVKKVTKAIKELAIETNSVLSSDVKDRILAAEKEETFPVAKNILEKIHENIDIAKECDMPLCQDTGVACVFLEIGQEVAWNMSFIEQESAEINPRYLETIEHSRELQDEMQSKTKQEV